MQVSFNSAYSYSQMVFKGNPLQESVNPKTLRDLASKIEIKIQPDVPKAPKPQSLETPSEFYQGLETPTFNLVF